MRISLTVNGERREADLWGGESLLTVLRDTLELPGSKNACEQGECGSCSVLLDGELVCSCLVLGAQAEGHEVVTVEGLALDDGLHPVQQAFVDAGAVYDHGEHLADRPLMRGAGGTVWLSAAFFRISFAVARGIGATTRVHVGGSVLF